MPPDMTDQKKKTPRKSAARPAGAAAKPRTVRGAKSGGTSPFAAPAAKAAPRSAAKRTSATVKAGGGGRAAAAGKRRDEGKFDEFVSPPAADQAGRRARGRTPAAGALGASGWDGERPRGPRAGKVGATGGAGSPGTAGARRSRKQAGDEFPDAPPASDGSEAGEDMRVWRGRQSARARGGNVPRPIQQQKLGRRQARGPGQGAKNEAPPERLHKALAAAGFGSRREMEEWIQAGRVNVNGMPAEVGQLVAPGDRVKVNGKLINLHLSASRLPRVLLYYKPEGEIVSQDDPEGRVTVFDNLPRMRGGRWIAVGRLDINTSGLLLFTTSGELANRLMHPRYEIIREYAVRTLGEIDEAARQALLDGVPLEDGLARFTTLVDGGGQGANHWYRVSLHEGRNREVRRMFQAVGVTVSRLMRVRYGPLNLPSSLRRGKSMELSERDVVALLEAVGMAKQRARPAI